MIEAEVETAVSGVGGSKWLRRQPVEAEAANAIVHCL